MIKLLILFFLALSLIPLTPIAYQKYVVWDAQNSLDDESWINEVLNSFSPRATLVEVKEGLELNPTAKIIDVRTEAEYDKKHITGAISIPEELVSEKIMKQIPDKSTVIYVYDDKTGNNGAVVVRLLKSLGYEKLNIIDGGYTAWEKAGYGVEEYYY
jgi:rhodanese-related sulfurtransferase